MSTCNFSYGLTDKRHELHTYTSQLTCNMLVVSQIFVYYDSQKKKNKKKNAVYAGSPFGFQTIMFKKKSCSETRSR